MFIFFLRRKVNADGSCSAGLIVLMLYFWFATFGALVEVINARKHTGAPRTKIVTSNQEQKRSRWCRSALRCVVCLGLCHYFHDLWSVACPEGIESAAQYAAECCVGMFLLGEHNRPCRRIFFLLFFIPKHTAGGQRVSRMINLMYLHAGKIETEIQRAKAHRAPELLVGTSTKQTAPTREGKMMFHVSGANKHTGQKNTVILLLLLLKWMLKERWDFYCHKRNFRNLWQFYKQLRPFLGWITMPPSPFSLARARYFYTIECTFYSVLKMRVKATAKLDWLIRTRRQRDATATETTLTHVNGFLPRFISLVFVRPLACDLFLTCLQKWLAKLSESVEKDDSQECLIGGREKTTQPITEPIGTHLGKFWANFNLIFAPSTLLLECPIILFFKKIRKTKME